MDGVHYVTLCYVTSSAQPRSGNPIISQPEAHRRITTCSSVSCSFALLLNSVLNSALRSLVCLPHSPCLLASSVFSAPCRTWTARDAAGNTATASRLYAVVDDQDTVVLGNIVVPVASPTAAIPLVQQTLSLGATAPGKVYSWTVSPQPGVGGKAVTKTGLS
jgi:hypothetical protein